MLVVNLGNTLLALIYGHKSYSYSNSYHEQNINTVYIYICIQYIKKTIMKHLVPLGCAPTLLCVGTGCLS